MKNLPWLYKSLLITAGVLFALFIAIHVMDLSVKGDGVFLVLGFVFLALSFRGYDKLKSFAYTCWIFAAVTVSMYYPEYFLKIGDFELKRLIVPLLQIIMFGMGSQMSVKDFQGVIQMPKGVIIGLLLQYTIMPVVGFGIASLFNFPTEIAAGIILIGCAPSGLASNVMSFMARANLALAITLATVGTILSPLLTPWLMKNLASQFIAVDFWAMMLDIIDMIILPIVAGLIFNLFSSGKAGKKAFIGQMSVYMIIILIKNFIYLQTKDLTLMEVWPVFAKNLFYFYLLPIVGALILKQIAKGDNEWLESLLAFISMAGIAVIITIITAAGRDSLLDVGILLILTSLLHNLLGYGLGYSVSKLSRLPEKDCRTIAFEVGMQNGGLASGLAAQMGKLATVGLAPAVFGPMMNITGSSLAIWWRGRPVKDGSEKEEEASASNKN
jgi:BASS family bile acid:Na+ symporter